MENSATILKYCGIFALIYAGLIILCNALPLIFKVEVSSGANAGIAIASVCAVVFAFVKDQGRAPHRAERRKLALGSLFVALIISSIGLFAVLSLNGENPASLFFELLDKITPILFGVISVIVMLVYYLALRFFYWFIGAIAAKAYSKS